MIKIYHNPRCRKSREALQILQESGKDFEIIEYLKESLSFDEVKAIIDLLNIPPIKLLRKNEAVLILGKALSGGAYPTNIL